MIDYEIKLENIGNIPVEEARVHEELINHLNYLLQEGFLEYEQDDDGEIRLYPA